MKTFLRLTIIFFLLHNFSLHAQKYQDPETLALEEWASLTQLLQKEAAYFQGKSGRVRLHTSDYTDFKIQKLTISEEKIMLDMHFTNRFFGETFKQEKRHNTFNFNEFDFRIKSVSLSYGNQWYFDDFPETVWLKFECFKKLIEHETTIQEQESESDVWIAKPNQKTKTSSFVFPIRSKNRERIFKAIDKFQSTILKYELQDQTNH